MKTTAPQRFEVEKPVDTGHIPPGKHAAVIGKNGSGKSQQLMRLALMCEQRVVILDTKLDDDFLFLAYNSEILEVAESYKETIKALKRGVFDYLIIRPQDFELASPEALDNYLVLLARQKTTTIFIDEAYMFHSAAGRSGPGFTALLTRGRSRGLSLIVATQRPAWLSLFTFSEASYFYIYDLGLAKDKAKVREFVPLPKEYEYATYHYWFYDTIANALTYMAPIKPFKRTLHKKPPIKGFFNQLFGA